MVSRRFWRIAEAVELIVFLIVTAIQHFDLSKILLTVYDPRIPRLGPSQRAAARRIEVSNFQFSNQIK